MALPHPALQIADAEVLFREAPVPQTLKTSFGAMNTRPAVILVLRDERGLSGLGESWVNFPLWAPQERMAALQRAFIPYLRGRKIEDIAACMTALETAFRGPCVQAGCVGPLLSALCAVELALWDLAAQAARVPLNALLFKQPAQRVRVYASGINAPLPWKNIDACLAQGVDLFKLKLGFGQDEDMKNLRALKQHFGTRARLAVDVNRKWTLSEALEWLPMLRDHDIQWLEEPLCVADEPRMGELLVKKLVPIAAGENVHMGPRAKADELAALPVDVLQPDITKYCSLSVALQLIAPAQSRGKRVVPHFLGSAPGQAASLHLASGCDAALVEWDINDNPLRTEFFAEPFEIKDGCIALPERPGLGWHLPAKA